MTFFVEYRVGFARPFLYDEVLSMDCDGYELILMSKTHEARIPFYRVKRLYSDPRPEIDTSKKNRPLLGWTEDPHAHRKLNDGSQH